MYFVCVYCVCFSVFCTKRVHKKHMITHYKNIKNNKKGSRAYFNTCDEPEDEDMDALEKEYFITTHGGIGGTPLNGTFFTFFFSLLLIMT